MKVYASPIQLEILKILYVAGTRLRPRQIREILLERARVDKDLEIVVRTPNLLYYHLRKLWLLKLIENDKISRDLSYYEIKEQGKRLVIAGTSKEDFLKEIASILASRLKKPKDQVYGVLASAFLNSEREDSVDGESDG